MGFLLFRSPETQPSIALGIARQPSSSQNKYGFSSRTLGNSNVTFAPQPNEDEEEVISLTCSLCGERPSLTSARTCPKQNFSRVSCLAYAFSNMYSALSTWNHWNSKSPITLHLDVLEAHFSQLLFDVRILQVSPPPPVTE